jgi:glutaredoxin
MNKLVVYTKDNCPNCDILKARLKREEEDFIEVNIGRDITREEFVAKYPTIRSVPHMVIEHREE